MTIYKLKYRLEILQKINAPAERECPQCKALELVKLVSAPQFQLKGTGWYETDFKHKGKPAANKTDEAAAPVATAEQKPTASDSSKPATTTDE
jgi:putative FmdB family regulatory protein